MELSLGCEFFVIKLAHNWWYQYSSRHKQSTCFYDHILRLNLILVVVCLLRHNLYFAKLLQLWNFLFPNKDSTYLSYLNNTILFNVNSLCWKSWPHLFPYLYNCPVTGNWHVFYVQFDSWQHYTLLKWIICYFSSLVNPLLRLFLFCFYNFEQLWHAFFPIFIDLERWFKLQSSVHLLLRCNSCLPSDQCYCCFSDG